MATDFISLLVNETLKLQADKAVDLSSLELKLQDYSLAYVRGFFIPQCQILRFKTDIGIIDIPINWSVFSADSHQNEVILDAQNDPDHLFEILKTHWNSSMEKMLVTHSDGFCYLIGLKAGEEVHIHDLLNPQEWLNVA
ncbi:MAG: hypothetical protein NDI69_09300 [Bacteriovoracaceae bacterium]|nr:hypothetical protein [Bacteriovoracaceae bacterium]